MTTRVKEAIELAAQGLGGVDRLIAWAKRSNDNETIFWSRIWLRLFTWGAESMFVEPIMKTSNSSCIAPTIPVGTKEELPFTFHLPLLWGKSRARRTLGASARRQAFGA
jgi:hypothetical protein